MASVAPQLVERPRFFSRLNTQVEGMVAKIDQSPGRVLLGLTVFYLLLTIPLAMIKLLWADEFITYYIARLNSISAIWDALGRGVDPNPPLSHILVMWSMRLFGDSEVALRLPAMLAGLLGVISIFHFLRRRVTTVYAAAGACFFLATAAFNYSYESRSYAFIMAFSILSLWMWQAALEGRYPRISAAALALSLAAGISSNYFAVLAFFPIAAGELVRDLGRRKIEWRVWLALAMGGLPFLAYLPLINRAIAQFAPHAWNRAKLDVIPDSYTEMVEVILIPALAIFALGIVHYYWERRKYGQVRPAILPRHEFIAVFTVLIYPMIGYVLAVTRAGMISPRFVIPVCWGFAIATVVTCYRVFARNALAAVFVLLLFFSWAIARDGFCAYDYATQRFAFQRILDGLPPAQTLVVADSLLVQPLYHYAPAGAASHIVFPLDFDLVRQYKREDSLEQNYWAGRGIFPVPIVSVKDLEQLGNYIIVSPNKNWLLENFAAQGTPAKLLNIHTDSHDIGGFTPLSHGETFLFEMGNALPRDEQYASTSQDGSANWGRGRRGRGTRGIQQ